MSRSCFPKIVLDDPLSGIMSCQKWESESYTHACRNVPALLSELEFPVLTEQVDVAASIDTKCENTDPYQPSKYFYTIDL